MPLPPSPLAPKKSRPRARFGRAVALALVLIFTVGAVLAENLLVRSSDPTFPAGTPAQPWLDGNGRVAVNAKIASIAGGVTFNATTMGSATTYYAVTTVAAPVGDFLELKNTSATVGRVARIIVGTPLAQATIKATRRSTADSGGTATALAIGSGLSKADTTDGAPALTAKIYTAAPTQGTSAGDVLLGLVYSTSGAGSYTYGAAYSKPITLRNGESVCLTSDTATNIPVMVEWTEAAQ